MFARSLVTLGLTLFSSRWVLRALGTEDFGLYSVVVSVVAMLTFLSGIMATSVARHLAFAIGKGNPGEVGGWFNAAVGVHLALAVVLALVGWPVGNWFITKHLNGTGAGVAAVPWVFALGLSGGLLGVLSVPFVALFSAHQRLAEPALIGMAQSIGVCVLAFWLDRSGRGGLIAYAVGMFVIVFVTQMVLVVRAWTLFGECRLRVAAFWNAEKTMALLRFAGWNLFGGVGATLRDSGSAVLLNLEFGPRVNAAYGVASQVAQGCNHLALALMGALSPEMATCAGRGDRERLLGLAQRVNKFGTLAVLLFAVPLMLQMEFVLQLWLAAPPPWAASFCRLVLLVFLVDRLSSGYMLAVTAHGRIAAYQATLGSLLILTLPLAWILLEFGAPPTGVYWASLVTILFCSVGRVLWVRRLLNASFRRWVCDSVLPCAGVALVMAGTGVTLGALVHGVAGDLLALLGSGASGLAVTWCLALSGGDRAQLRGLRSSRDLGAESDT